jgi:hypothetical protein
MGKIQITVDTTDTDDKRQMKFEAEQCTELDIAIALREAFLVAKNNNLVRRSILLQVLKEIVEEI